MPDLPARPDLDQLRHQAKDMLHAAQRGDPGAISRIRAVSDRLILSSAQLAIAREYGFASWAKLKLEVERRDILNGRDLSRLTRLLAEHPELATEKMEHWRDHPTAPARSATWRCSASTTGGSGCRGNCPAPERSRRR